MITLNRRLIKKVMFWVLLLIVVPVVYVNLLDAFVSHPGLNLISQWSDNSFQDWSMLTNAPINGTISNEGGPLRITMEGPCSSGNMVAAQKTRNLPAELAPDEYLKVSIKASSINVAARIVIWTDFDHPQDVLVKTYNDNEWHTEIVSLAFFQISGKISMVELSIMRLNASDATEWVSYKEFSFGTLEL